MLLVWSDHLCCVFLQNNSTALHHAAREGHNNVVTFLCSHGAGVNDVDDEVSSMCVCVHEVAN